MNTPHKHAEVLRAIADGNDVQCRKPSATDWYDYRHDGCGYDPLTNHSWEWRIKPEPKPDVVRYIAMNKEWGYSHGEYVSRFHADGGYIQVIFDAETGKPKSAEVV